MNWLPVLHVLMGATLAMTAVWWVQVRTRNGGYVDVAWSYLMAAAAVYYAWVAPGALAPRIAVGVLGAIWGLRLGTHLLVRVHGEPEDGRYKHMRAAIGDREWLWFAFFMFQAGLTALLSIPFWIAANNSSAGVTPWLVVGVAVWLVSVMGESIADRQLAAFRADSANRGKVCERGLWAYSRHPNYFFEWLHWFAYVALAIGSAHWYVALLGPLMMLCALLWVTGIPFVEQQSLRSRGEAYRDYQRRVSMFVPWFSRA
jgi:steroid 5-alpha reductase family enzyme